MKLKFKNQDFQTDAVNAVADLFAGQERMRSSFTVQVDNTPGLFGAENEYGIGNKLQTDLETLQVNMHAVQKRHNLPLTELEDGTPEFSIEMETGTGKTYVYTKTIFELNQRYGFTKFIIVVPSVAIREGVHKSLQVTGDHFARHYDHVPNRYFVYNSKKLSDIRQFATSADIEIMIINIDAFKKEENIINQAQDKLNGETAMRYIQDTNPVVIIDEPQSVNNTQKAKEAIASLNPLCVLRYSATHREVINLLYRLTPVDAYQMGLVKQISVSSNQAFNDHNKPYIRVVSADYKNGYTAKIEMDVAAKDGKVSRKTVTAKERSDLFVLSGNRDLYDGYVISGIDCTEGFAGVEFNSTDFVRVGEAIGGVDELAIKKVQIYRTIETHLRKELMYHAKGIKVLSLFFIDEVKKYRDENGEKGIYAQLFEECYNELLAKSLYAPLKTKFPTDVAGAHNGYFSQDKKGHFKDTKGDSQADDDTYNTIMRDKEWLLSFECPLRFIFSHSALKEGWDNPNVFQVCTLIEQKSTFTARQKVGRGLRLCVDQDGNRIEDKDINILHVMANESFSEFATALQTEIESDTGVKFGYVDIGLFEGIVLPETREEVRTVTAEQAAEVVETLTASGVISDNGTVVEPARLAEVTLPEPLKVEVTKLVEQSQSLNTQTLSTISYTQITTEEQPASYEDRKELVEFFEHKGYVKSGKVQDTMKAALLAGTLDLPQKWEAARDRIAATLTERVRPIPLRDASKEVTVRLKKQVVEESPLFKELWDKIKHKTTYRVTVDTEELIKGSVKDMARVDISEARIISDTARVVIDRSGVQRGKAEGTRDFEVQRPYDVLPNIVGVLSERCLITRQTVNRILTESGKMNEFLNNPQKFIEEATTIINAHRHRLAIDGIKYKQLPGMEYSVMEIFDSKELFAVLDENAVKVDNTVYDYVKYDSVVERNFAVALDGDPDVRMFFKIPPAFKIETPIGTYNPDWAVYLEQNGEKKLYFVLETKGTMDIFGLRGSEAQKIHCGKVHFEALKNGVKFPDKPVTDWSKFRSGM